MWKFEKVFTDDGSELSTSGHATALGDALNAAYDGRFMWVTCTNGIAIYEFWGASSNDEPTVDEVDDLLWQRYTEEGPLRKLKLITFISIGAQLKRSTRYKQLSLLPSWPGGAGSEVVGDVTVTVTQKRDDLEVYTEVSTNSSGSIAPYWIAKVGSKMVVTSGANFSRCVVLDIDTQRVSSFISFGNEPDLTLPLVTNSCDDGLTNAPQTPIVANSNLLGANGHVWFVNTFFNDSTPQRLYRLNLTTQTLTYDDIPVRPQEARAWLANGFNGFVYVSNYNGVSVCRFDIETGLYAERIRVNAFPTRIFTDQNRRIFVGSFGGMLSLLDWSDDSLISEHGTELDGVTPLHGFAADPVTSNLVWFSKEAESPLVRYNLDNNQQYELVGDSDWSIEPSGIVAPTWLVSLVSRTYNISTGTRTQRPYLFMCDGAQVALSAMDWYLVRDNFFEVNGQGAVVGGTLEYFGEAPEPGGDE